MITTVRPGDVTVFRNSDSLLAYKLYFLPIVFGLPEQKQNNEKVENAARIRTKLMLNQTYGSLPQYP